MKRKKLPPEPEPVPAGWMYYAGELRTIPWVENNSKGNMAHSYIRMPHWRNDPTYNMKLTKQPTTTKEK